MSLLFTTVFTSALRSAEQAATAWAASKGALPQNVETWARGALANAQEQR